jgi:hypothetical protein
MYVVFTAHQETLSLQERHVTSGVPRVDQGPKTFHLGRAIYSRAQWIE